MGAAGVSAAALAVALVAAGFEAAGYARMARVLAIGSIAVLVYASCGLRG